jgi:hypothetical protein
MSVSGMEAPLFTFFVLASMLCATSRLELGAFTLAGLAILTRPEGAVWMGTLIVYSVLREKTIPWRGILTTLVVVAPWVAFAVFYYGSPIPQSALAKSNWISDSLTVWSFLWRETSFLNIWTGFTGLGFASLPFAIRVAIPACWWVFFLAGVGLASRAKRHELLLVSGFFLAYVGFFYFGNARVFEWYHFPAIVSGAVVVTYAAGVVLERASSLLSRARVSYAFGRILPPAVAAGVILALMGLLAYKVPGYREAQAYEDRVRRPCGEYLYRCTAPSETVMLEPIGYIGYFSERRIVDLAGLVSPLFAKIKDKAAPGWVIEQLRRIRPEIIVLRAYEVPSNRFFAAGNTTFFSNGADSEWFRRHYREDAMFGATDWAMVVYRRDGVPSQCASTP